MRIRLGLWVCAFLLNPVTTTTRAAPVPAMGLGDAAFLRRAEPGAAAQALGFYREAFQSEPSAQTAWRLAAACYFEGYRGANVRDEDKARLFAEGRDAGEQGVARDPACAPCHFWTAINMALYGDTVGALKMLTSLGSIERHLQAVIRIDPGYASGGAYRILGMIAHRLPGILGGSDARAREDFEKAIAIAPADPLNYWTLWKFWLDRGDQAAALRAAAAVATLPVPAASQVESREAYTEVRSALAASASLPTGLPR
jgi:tetratricopeptide (TPR) repeat protein